MPHPVMGIPGDIEGTFEIQFDMTINRGKRDYKIANITPTITNPYISSLLADGYIDLIIKIVCVPTYQSWTFRNPESISLPENEIDVLIEVEAFLVVGKQIKNYSSPTFNSIFLNSAMTLSTGEIVGLTGPKKIPVSKENEKVSVGSIFKFSRIKNDEEIQELNFFYDDDQITIYYPAIEGEMDPVHVMFDLNQGAPYIAINIYILPALTEAFRILMDETSDKDLYVAKRWAIVLDTLLPENERDKDPFINAQRIIPAGLPTNLAFTDFLNLKK